MSDYEEVEEHADAAKQTFPFKAHVRYYEVELLEPPPGWRRVLDEQSVLFYGTVEAAPAEAQKAALTEAVRLLEEYPASPGDSMGNTDLLDIASLKMRVTVDPDDIDITLEETP